MTLSHQQLAEALLVARESATPSPRPSALGVDLDPEAGYTVQHAQQRILEQRGEHVVALKLGLTDQGQRDRANWQAPSYGFLTNRMLLTPGQPLEVGEGITPRVEPEIVAVLNADITTPLTSREDLLDVLEGIHLGIEVVDPRYVEPAFVLADALADNASAFRAVYHPDGVDARSRSWADEVLTLSVNGAEVASGVGSALMGDPLVSVWHAINERLRHGFTVTQGLALFSGNVAGVAIPVTAGDVVHVASAGLGQLELVVS